MGCAISTTNKVSSRDPKINLTKVTKFNPDQETTPVNQNCVVSSQSSAVVSKRISTQTLLTLQEESVIDEFRNGPGHRFFKEFPTPKLLEEAQAAFMKCNYDIPESNNKSPSYPVQSWKKDIFNLTDFADLDRHAAHLPSNLRQDSLQDLVQGLVEPAKDGLGVVRVIFRWISAQDVNRIEFTGEEPSSTAGYYLKRIQQGHGGYAELFQKMCTLADITCVLIPGFVKGVGYEPGEDVTRHVGVWSAVLLDGNWRLVDCQWGSSHVTIDGTLSGADKTGEKPRTTADTSYAYDEFYFLTDPHHLIYSHFPYDDRWQLLARPLRIDEFQNIAYLKPSFFQLGFDIVDSPQSVLVAEAGRCDISLQIPHHGRRRFIYRLYLLESNGSQTNLGTNCLENFVFLERIKQENIVMATLFFPCTGKYKFKLFSKDTSMEPSDFSSICSHVIYCDQAISRTDFEPFPTNPRYEWGLGAETDVLGIQPVSHTSGYIETLAGEVELRLRLSNDIEFLHKLTRVGEPEHKYKNHVFHRYENGEIVFKIRLPRIGKYMLSIFAKGFSEEGSFPNVCNFLIECDNPSDDPSPFPPVYNGRVGPNDNFRKLKMSTVGGESGFFVCSESGELVIRFQMEEPVWLIPKLCLQAGDGYKEFDEFAMCSKEPGTVSVHMLFPEPGFYQFILYGKRSDSTSNGYPSIYYGLIQADFPKIGAVPFPKIFSKWKDNFKLIEPVCGFLPTHDKIRFLVDIQESEGVAVIGSTWTHLNRNESGLWDGMLETGDTECDLKLSACLTPGSGKYSCLQLFKVMSDKTLKTLSDKQKEKFKDCQVRLKLRQQKLDRLNIGLGRYTDENLERRKPFQKTRKPEKTEESLNGEDEVQSQKIDENEVMKKLVQELARGRTDDANIAGSSEVRNHDGTNIGTGADNQENVKGSERIVSSDDHHEGQLGTDSSRMPRSESATIAEQGEIQTESQSNITSGAQVLNGRDIDKHLVQQRQQETQDKKSQETIQHVTETDSGSATNYQFGGHSVSTTSAKSKKVNNMSKDGMRSRPVSSKQRAATNKSRPKSAKVVNKTQTIDHEKDNGGKDLKQLEGDILDIERQASILEFTLASGVNAQGDDAEKQKQIAEAMRAQAARDKLQVAIKKQDRALIEAAVKAFKALKIQQEGTELDDAQRHLDRIAIKEAILKAIDAKDIASLKRFIAQIKDKGFDEELRTELSTGVEKLKTLERISKYKSSVLSMDANTMTEMRRYNNPPEVVHQVMAAALLMLGDHEGITKKWKNCQKRCNPTGPDGLKRRVLDFDVDKLHPEIAARVGQILEEQNIDEVKMVSSGAATFYIWAKGMINEISTRLTESNETVTPANKFRQKQILLGRGDITDDELDRPMSRVSLARPSTTRTIRSVRRQSITVR